MKDIKQALKKSLAMQKKSSGLIPGMTQLLSKRPDMFSLGVWPGYFSKAKGAEVWDLDGNRYLDMSISGIGANVLGYCFPEVDAAVIKVIRNGTSCSLNCPEEVELAQLLCTLHPWADMARFTRAGGESMAVAARIARAATGKDKIAFCGYHGWHDWYLSANLGTENALGDHLLPGLSPNGVPSGLKGTMLPFRYNNIDELKAIVEQNRGQLAAIVLEPVRNDEPADGFLKKVRTLADKAKAVLVIDEISSGFRMNTGGAHLCYGLEPDIAVFSKAMGNGYPIGAIIGRRDIMQAAQTTFISSTYWTERIGPTAAIATIQAHKSHNAGRHLVKIGKVIQLGWARAAKKYGLQVHVGGIYPLSHFSFDADNGLSMKALFVQLMLQRGILASTSFYSMLVHTSEHVDRYLEAVDEVFAIIAKADKLGEIDNMLVGKPASAGFRRLN